MMETLTFDEIKKLYPNEWVLLENPAKEDAQILSGTVLLHHPDKRTLLDQAIELRKTRKLGSITVDYAGDLIVTYRPWLGATILREKPLTI